MTSFPFCSLPWVLQREVLKRLDILDAFKFAMLSEKTSLLSQRNHSVTPIHWNFIKNQVHLELGCDYKIVMRGPTESTVDTNHGQFRIGDNDVVMKEKRRAREQELIIESGVGTNLIDLIYPIWESVSRMMKIKDTIKIDITSYGITLSLATKVMELSKTYNHIGLLGKKVTTAQIKFLFEEISCKKIWLQGDLPRNKAYLQPLKHQCIHLDHIEFISLDALVKSEMIELYILDDCLSDTDLNSILKSWLQGGLPNLQRFEMDASSTNHMEDTILDGIPWTPFTKVGKPDYQQIEPRFAMQKYDEGFDIKRADGMTATLLMKYTEHLAETIEIFVWHNDFKASFNYYYA